VTLVRIIKTNHFVLKAGIKKENLIYRKQKMPDENRCDFMDTNKTARFTKPTPATNMWSFAIASFWVCLQNSNMWHNQLWYG